MRIDEDGVIHVDSLDELRQVVDDLMDIDEEDEEGEDVDYEQKFRELNEQYTYLVDTHTSLVDHFDVVYQDVFSAKNEANQLRQERDAIVRLYQQALGKIAGLEQKVAISKLRNSLSDGVEVGEGQAQGQVLQQVPDYLS